MIMINYTVANMAKIPGRWSKLDGLAKFKHQPLNLTSISNPNRIHITRDV